MPSWVWWLLALAVVDVAIYAALAVAGRADDDVARWLANQVPPSPESRYEELRLWFLEAAERVAPNVMWSVGEQTDDLVAKRLLDIRGRLRVEEMGTLGVRLSVSFATVEHEPEAVALGLAGRLCARERAEWALAVGCGESDRRLDDGPVM